MGLFSKYRKLRSLKKGVEKFFSLTVKDVMTDYVVTISPTKNITDAAALMIGEDISAIIVEEEGKPTGILTERDFITKVPLSKEVFGMQVKDIMSCGFGGGKPGKCAIEAVKSEASLSEARKLLKEKHIRKLVITKDDGFLWGIITQTDLAKVVHNAIKVIVKLDNAPYLVKDIMTKKLVTVDEKSSFANAKEVMTKHNVSALPIKKGKDYVGLFTEYDVVGQFYDAGGRLDIRNVPDIMKTPVKCIPAGLNILDANTIMIFQKVRRLLVVEEGKVVGFVSQTDLIHACFDYLEKLHEHLKSHGKVDQEEITGVHQKSSIISEYASEHLRAYTVKD